jgi:hypothetical protein
MSASKPINETISASQLAKLVGATEDVFPQKHRNKDGSVDLLKALQCVWEYGEDKCNFISTADLAGLVNLTPSRIRQMIATGEIERDASGRLPYTKTLKAMARIYQERASEGDSPLSVSKRQKHGLELQLLRLKVKKIEDRFITREAADRAWFHIVRKAREKFAGLAKEISPELMRLKSEAQLEEFTQRRVDQYLEELSRPTDYVDAPGNPNGAITADYTRTKQDNESKI